MRETLTDNKDLKIDFVVDGDQVQVEITSKPGGPDLSVPDEVIVVVNGEARPVEVASEREARAVLGDEEELAAQPLQLMVRVHEFFEGWEFDAD